MPDQANEDHSVKQKEGREVSNRSQEEDELTQSRKGSPEGSSATSELRQGDYKDGQSRDKKQKRGRQPWRGRNQQGDTLDTANGRRPKDGDCEKEDNCGSKGSLPTPKRQVVPGSTSSDSELGRHNLTGEHRDDSTTPGQPPNEDVVVPLCVDGMTPTEMETLDEDEYQTDATVPMVRVCLLQTVRVPPRQYVLAKAKVGTTLPTSPVLFEPDETVRKSFGVHLEEALLEPCDDDVLQVPLANPTRPSKLGRSLEVWPEHPWCTWRKTSRFLGLASYYRRFIPNFAKVAQPIHRVTCKDAWFCWSPECEQAFEELKRMPTSTPVLAYPLRRLDSEDAGTATLSTADLAQSVLLEECPVRVMEAGGVDVLSHRPPPPLPGESDCDLDPEREWVSALTQRMPGLPHFPQPT